MITKDGQIVSFTIEEGSMVITVDPNKDGQALLSLKIDLLEVPDEIVSLIKKSKD